MSPDGLKIAVGTGHGSVGVLDVSTHAYRSLLRSHSQDILALCGRPFPDLPHHGTGPITAPVFPAELSMCITAHIVELAFLGNPIWCGLLRYVIPSCRVCDGSERRHDPGVERQYV